jgi:hypothetical protein
MVTEREFFHSNNTRTQPPAVQNLRELAGCGSSSVVRYEGTGAYFLERLVAGVWRLEVYPDAVWVNDPYGPHRLDREVARILWRQWPMDIRLPDLGEAFSVTPLNEGNDWRAQAKAGRFAIRPGVFLLERAGLKTGAWETAPRTARVGLREFVAGPSSHAPPVVRHDLRSDWVEGKPMPVSFTVVTAQEPEQVTFYVAGAGLHSAPSPPLPLARAAAYHFTGTVPGEWLAPGQVSCRLEVRAAGATLLFPTNPAGGVSSGEAPTIQESRSGATNLGVAASRQHSPAAEAGYKWKKLLRWVGVWQSAALWRVASYDHVAQWCLCARSAAWS